MGLFRKLAGSADLVSGMAQRLGADMQDQIMSDPEAGARRFAAMVYRCAGCTDQDGCAALQAENDRLDHAPAYCRNADAF
ncbi:MAG: adenylosuccinate lyase [Rhodobacteraceae bacterium]|nr:MAG: adenylosuccinate lyase [Paracoccaceae bacterium]